MKAKVTYVTPLRGQAIIGVVPFQWEGDWIMSLKVKDYQGIYAGHWIEIIRCDDKFGGQKYKMSSRPEEDNGDL